MVTAKDRELNYNFTVECRHCERAYEIFMDYDDFHEKFVKGMPIEQAMPYMPKDMQILLTQRIGPCCWKNPVTYTRTEQPEPQEKKTRRLVTKKGREVVTPYTDEEMVEKLAKIPGDSDFVLDIIKKRKKLRGDQVIWGHILVVEYEAKEEAKKNPQPQAPKHIVGDMKKIIEMFEQAKQHLKYPKIRLTIGDSQIRLSMAGEKSKYPGAIQVVREIEQEVYGNQYRRAVDKRHDWLGRINTDGTFTPDRNLHPEFLPQLIEFLKKFAKDPLAVAREYGLLTGNCCFCNKTLTATKSTDVGYGPICAKHYGLVW